MSAARSILTHSACKPSASEVYSLFGARYKSYCFVLFPGQTAWRGRTESKERRTPGQTRPSAQRFQSFFSLISHTTSGKQLDLSPSLHTFLYRAVPRVPQLVPSKRSLLAHPRSSNKARRRNTALRHCYCPLSRIDYAHCMFSELLIIIMICKFAADHSTSQITLVR